LIPRCTVNQRHTVSLRLHLQFRLHIPPKLATSHRFPPHLTLITRLILLLSWLPTRPTAKLDPAILYSMECLPHQQPTTNNVVIGVVVGRSLLRKADGCTERRRRTEPASHVSGRAGSLRDVCTFSTFSAKYSKVRGKIAF